MPQRGQLTIGTANVDPDGEAGPGPYVLLAVSDTAKSMTPEVKARLRGPKVGRAGCANLTSAVGPVQG